MPSLVSYSPISVQTPLTLLISNLKWEIELCHCHLTECVFVCVWCVVCEGVKFYSISIFWILDIQKGGGKFKRMLSHFEHLLSNSGFHKLVQISAVLFDIIILYIQWTQRWTTTNCN